MGVKSFIFTINMLKRRENGELLTPRIEDLFDRMQKNGMAAGDFLTPEEQAEAAAVLKHLKKETPFYFSFEGGIKGAERACALLSLWRPEEDRILSDIGVRFLKIRFKSGALPSHPAVLGSILALGIERKALGDIFLYKGAMLVAAKESVAPYIKDQLSRVGREAAEAEYAFIEKDFEIVRETERLSVSVSSLRLDCTVAAICRLSREEASSYIAAGQASVNHKPVTKCDYKLSPEAVLSLRGYGRYLLKGTVGTTKSGRMRLEIEKFV